MLIVNIDAGPTRHSLVSMYISLLSILMQKTPLHVATKLEIVKFLVESGADVDAKTNTGVCMILFRQNINIVSNQIL